MSLLNDTARNQYETVQMEPVRQYSDEKDLQRLRRDLKYAV